MFHRKLLLLAHLVAAYSLCAGCMTLEQMAPPVGDPFVPVARNMELELSELVKGRDIYISDCVRCHSVEPISRYGVDKWKRILPRMIKDTKLDADEASAVSSYVFAAQRVLEQSPSQMEAAQAARTETEPRESSGSLGRN